MLVGDLMRLGAGALRGHRLRSALCMLGIGIGITSVMLLTAIGEGTRRYIISQFTQFGTNLIAVNPGKVKTLGMPGVLGGTTRKLTIEDSEAISRVNGVEAVMPFAMGSARVEAQGRGRSVYVYGVTPEVPNIWKFRVRQGTFWAKGDPRRRGPYAVLGPTLKRELFGEKNALGEFVRIGGTRFQVTGIMEPKGRMLGFDIDDSVYIPVASALKLFNLSELMEIDILFSNASVTDAVVEGMRSVLIQRHDGNEDFTITTQTAMLEVFGKVMSVITMSVGVIAGISILVGAIGILTMMWIAVGERTAEIGLIRSIGATSRQVYTLFLFEALVQAMGGGLAGLVAGLGFNYLLRSALPGLPVHTPALFVVLAIAISLLTGLAAGVLPARRAASLHPVESLRAE